MAASSNIAYLPHDHIDKTKWNKCIDASPNGLIYGYSFYLDHMAKHWDGLVLDDYKAVMPLTWNKKWGIYYLYQPAFTASLGVFACPDDSVRRGNGVNEDVVGKFIQAIPKKFQFVDISLNAGNSISPGYSILRSNYILSLNRSYDDLRKNYRENHQRNIQKSQEAGCLLKRNITMEEIIELNKEQMKHVSPIANDEYQKFKKLCYFLYHQNKTMSYCITGKDGKLLSSCIFFFSHKRAYYILAGNHSEGRNVGASHALIDGFIRECAGKDLVLDFEGSDIESLAHFYRGFGATEEKYPAIRLNRLSWWMRWLKK